MVKFYLRSVFLITCIAGLLTGLQAQTTISTAAGTTGYTANNGVTGNAAVTFVVENTNTYDIFLTGIETYKTASSPSATTTFTLWYSTTSLSGAATITTPTWTQIATSNATGLAVGYNTVFSGLTFIIPAGTQYRFALQSSSGLAYSGAAAGGADPDIFTAAGVNLKVGEATIGGSNVGYAGAFPTPPNSPRWFTGSVTIQQAAVCSGMPTAGTITSSTDTVSCGGSTFLLGLSGTTVASGLTYQWQTSTDGATFTNISSATTSSLTTSQTASTYYRAAISCGSSTAYTDTLYIKTPLLVSGTYTVNNTIPTGGTNFQTFRAAVNYFQCGINGPLTLNVGATSGPYNEQVIIPAVTGTSSTNTITINGNGRSLNFNSTNSDARAGIMLNGTDHVKIDNLVINGTGTTTTDYNFGIQLMNNADSNTISNCTINLATGSTAINFAGIVLNGSASSAASAASDCDYNVIQNNTITGGYYGVSLYGSTTAASAIMSNKVLNNVITDFYVYGVYVYGSNGTLVEGNDLSRPTRTSASTFSPIYFSTGSSNALVNKNRIHDPFGGYTTATTSTVYGVYFGSSDGTAGNENVVSNNLIYNMNNGGIQYLFYNSSSDYVRYYHNTAIADDNSYTGSSSTYGFYQITSATGIDLKNNIIIIGRSGTGTKANIYISTAATTFTSDYNDLLMNSTTGTTYIGYHSSGYTTLAAWQTGTGKDANSLSINPAFVAPASGDFRPSATTLNNKGTFVGITTDIRNITRSTTTPDLGAYEFGEALPVKLLSLVASKWGKDILVNWTSTAEINFSHYEVERSADGSSFTQIGTRLSVAGAAITNNYSLTDRSIAAASTAKMLYYRLKMVDKDGKMEYSKIVAVNLGKDAVPFVKAYPSPFVSSLYIQVEIAQATTMQATLADAAGKVLISKNYHVVQGNNTVVMNDLGKIQRGTYLLTVTVNGRRSTTTIVK